MFNKLIHKRSLIILLVFVLFLFLVNIIISNIIQKKITELLLKQNSKYYTVKVEDVRFKALKRSIVLKNIFLSPSSESFRNLKNKKSEKSALEKIEISSIELDGIHLLKILFKNDIEVNTLKVNNLLIQQFANKKIKKNKSENINTDSIYIKKLNGLQINKIKVKNLTFQIIDATNNEITFQNKPVSFSFTGFKLKKISDNYFKLIPLNDKLEIDKINIDFPEIKYNFSIDALNVDIKNKIIQIKNLKYTPLAKRDIMVNLHKFNDEIYDVKIEDLKLFNLDIDKLVNKKGLFIDSIALSKLDIKIFKDKRKPFDLNKRPKLLHMALKQMKSDLLIHKISISNSKMLYEERLEKKDLLLTVSLTYLNAQIFNVTSIKKYRVKPLKVNLTSKLLDNSAMKLDLEFPLKDGQDTFYFNGSLGPSEFKYFDSAVFPALGIKILKGDLDDLAFSASADESSSSGTMTMLYHDLEAKIFKSKTTDKNKFLSWTVNRVIHSSNPGKNGKKREAIMQTNRVIYKGVVNYIWKTLQSGITNSIAPIGKTSPTKQKQEKKGKRSDKKEARKQKKKS